MKAARLHAYHDPLALDEVDEPRATGPLEVVVRIGAAGLCRTDLHIQEGQWAEKSGVTLPYTLGHENAGWIHEVGSGVTDVEVDHTVRVDGSHVDTVRELTNGIGAEVILDFVGEKGAVEDGIAMVQDGGFYYVIGYGQNLVVPTIDIISREISFIGNLVGTYADLEELMTLTAQGKVRLHTNTYPLDAVNDAMADLDGGRLQGRGILVPAATG